MGSRQKSNILFAVRWATLARQFRSAAIMAILIVLVIPVGALAVLTHTGFINWGANSIDELDVAFDGSTFYTVGFSDTWGSFDTGGNFLGTTNFVLPGISTRGIAYDANSGNIWANDLGGTVSQFTTGGSLVSSFNSGLTTLNAVTVDTSTDTLWLADFSSTLIRNVTKTGSLISQFNGGFNWSGIAYESVSDTLLAIETGDKIYEFTKAGGNLGLLFGPGGYPIGGNEFGLAFDAAAGNLLRSGAEPKFC